MAVITKIVQLKTHWKNLYVWVTKVASYDNQYATDQITVKAHYAYLDWMLMQC